MNEVKTVSFLEYIKRKKSVLWIGGLLIIGVLLMIFPTGADNKLISTDEDKRLSDYSNELEGKIEDMCARVRGVSDVSATVYFDRGFETEYAFDEESRSTTSGTNTEKKHVTIGSGNDEKMVIVRERMPNICGIAIVCRGGGDPVLSAELINLISAAYGVPKSKIYIAEGKS